MHILVEGLDLAGKSTICRLLKEHFGPMCQIRNNSLLPKGENPVFAFADAMRKEDPPAVSDPCVGHLYYAALLEDLSRFEAPAGIVVQDSTILGRSLAYHAACGTPDLPTLFEAQKPNHPRFDAAFYCRVTPETRCKRLGQRARKNLAADDFIFQKDPALFAKMERRLSDYVVGFHGGVEIETDGDLKHDEAKKAEIVGQIISRIPCL